MTVYLDVLFCVNLIVDYMLLLSVRKLMALSARRRRLLAGASVGAVGSFVLLLPPMGFILSLSVSVAEALLMTAAAFCPLSRGRYVRASLLLFAVSFLYSGFMAALRSLWHPQSLTVRNNAVYIGISPLLLVSLTLIFYLMLQLFFSLTAKETNEKTQCLVRLRWQGHVIEVRGLIDTGNTLHEPFSGESVIIVKCTFFPELSMLSERSAAKVKGLRMIPYTSVGGGGVLPAFRPEELTLMVGRHSSRVQAYVALSSRAEQTGEYDAIVPAELLSKGS